MGYQKIQDNINRIIPLWARCKDIDEARKEGRVFNSIEELLENNNLTKEDFHQFLTKSYILKEGQEQNVYHCTKCNAYVIGCSKHPDYMDNKMHSAKYPGLCEFCNSPVRPA